ncbi:hypothetical protein [Neobacillus cucumis]|nr:hypothetical protein [Neobacillus cucumis]
MFGCQSLTNGDQQKAVNTPLTTTGKGAISAVSTKEQIIQLLQ